MTMLLISYDDRDLEYIEMSWELNTQRCHNLGYTFEIHRTYAATLPPWWVKVFLINDYLRRNSLASDSWIVWLDSDAIVSNGPLTLDSFLKAMPDSCHFVGSFDYLGRPGSMNAGVFAVRNSELGHAIMQTWCHSYDPARWRFRSGSWVTDGAWAGSTFEQGAFNERVMCDGSHRSTIRLCGNDFVSYEFDFAGCVKHFPVEFHSRIKAYCELSKIPAGGALCVRFGGEYHELSSIDDGGLHMLCWPLRFPVSTACKVNEGTGDVGFWDWRHDGSTVNGNLQLLADGSVNSSWFGKDGWWYRRNSLSESRSPDY